jgi:hypothetical protein
MEAKNQECIKYIINNLNDLVKHNVVYFLTDKITLSISFNKNQAYIRLEDNLLNEISDSILFNEETKELYCNKKFSFIDFKVNFGKRIRNTEYINHFKNDMINQIQDYIFQDLFEDFCCFLNDSKLSFRANYSTYQIKSNANILSLFINEIEYNDQDLSFSNYCQIIKERKYLRDQLKDF